MHSRNNNKHDSEQKAWLELISRYEYDLFVNLTFREEIEPWKAEKRFEKWIGSLNCDLFGWRYRRQGKGIRYVVVIEHQKRGVLHFHALLGAKGLKMRSRVHMAKLWETNGQRNENGIFVDRIVNGLAVIKRYDPKRGAIRYITKDIPKGVLPDIFVPRREREGQVPEQSRPLNK